MTHDPARSTGRGGASWLPWLGAGILVLAALAVVDVATSTEPRRESVRVPPSLTGPELIACSHRIVVGEVRTVEEVGRGKSTIDVVVDAQEWLKPASDTKRGIEVTTLSPRYATERRPRPGQRVLVIEWSHPYERATRVFRSDRSRGTPGLADVRAEIKHDLAHARHTRCPAFWSDPEGYRSPGGGDT